MAMDNIRIEKQYSSDSTQRAISMLIDKDVKIADLDYCLNLSADLIREGILIIKDPTVPKEIVESYLSRTCGFLLSR